MELCTRLKESCMEESMAVMSDHFSPVTERREAGGVLKVPLAQCAEADAQQIMSRPSGGIRLRISYQSPARLDSVAAG